MEPPGPDPGRPAEAGTGDAERATAQRNRRQQPTPAPPTPGTIAAGRGGNTHTCHPTSTGKPEHYPSPAGGRRSRGPAPVAAGRQWRRRSCAGPSGTPSPEELAEPAGRPRPEDPAAPPAPVADQGNAAPPRA